MTSFDEVDILKAKISELEDRIIDLDFLVDTIMSSVAYSFVNLMLDINSKCSDSQTFGKFTPQYYLKLVSSILTTYADRQKESES